MRQTARQRQPDQDQREPAAHLSKAPTIQAAMMPGTRRWRPNSAMPRPTHGTTTLLGDTGYEQAADQGAEND